MVARHIYVPTDGPDDWRRLLAAPEKHWKAGYSARALAECWEAADGWPPEIAALWSSSSVASFRDAEMVLAIPEYKIRLPGRGGSSQTDLVVLARSADDELIAIAIEGKVSEKFGKETLGRWYIERSSNKRVRLDYIKRKLGLAGELPDNLRYQLLHRTASAVVLAERFCAHYAVMLVHSFSPIQARFGDYCNFLAMFEQEEVQTGKLLFLRECDGVSLYSAWACGDLSSWSDK